MLQAVGSTEMQTAVVWTCLCSSGLSKTILQSTVKRGKKKRRTEEEVRRQHHGMDRPGVQQVPEGSGEKAIMKKTGCEVVCGIPTTLAVKELVKEGKEIKYVFHLRHLYKVLYLQLIEDSVHAACSSSKHQPLDKCLERE